MIKDNAKVLTMRLTRRGGLAVVELAVVLPIVLLLLFGTVEFGRAIMVEHVLQEAATAGCRVYAVRDTTQQEAQDIIDTAVTDAGIEGHSIEFDPPTKAEIDEPMELVTVSVSVNYDSIGWVSPFFLSSRPLTGRCTLPADLYEVENEIGANDIAGDDDEDDGNVRHDDN